MLQAIAVLRQRMEAAVGTETNADRATESGIKRGKADEWLKMNPTRPGKTL